MVPNGNAADITKTAKVRVNTLCFWLADGVASNYPPR